MQSLARIVARRGVQFATRSLSTTSSMKTGTQDLAPAQEITPAEKEEFYPKLGNRDIVGFGMNGNPVYIDNPDFPAPAIRFKENTPEILALREKEAGDWHELTVDEIKTLYRASFCKTYAEMKAPNSEWKSVLAGVLTGLGVTLWVLVFMKSFVYPPMIKTMTKEWQEEEVRMVVKQRQGAVTGISSKFDYEKGDWK